MQGFQKRIYRSPCQFWREFVYIMSRRKDLRRIMRGGTVSPAFRERLMLAVTGVNGCRYCSYRHSQDALEHGVDTKEIEGLLEGETEECPDEQKPAILYAQHWAEMGGEPSEEARAEVERRYGSDMLEDIELILRIIRLGNLAGNTADYFLYIITFGRLGGGKPGVAQ
jgi:AhpD family alkylhydroperoxidase